MRNILRKYIAVVAALLLLGGCIKEHPVGGFCGEGTITLRLSLPQGNGGTRSIAAEPDATGENRIDEVAILALTQKGSDWVFDYEARIVSKVQSDGELTVTARVREMSELQQFVILVNAASELTAASPARYEKIDDIESRLVCSTGGGEWPANNNGDGNFTPFPMYARTAAQIVNESNNPVGTYSLIRMVARINITLNGGINNFTLEEACLFNYRTAGYVSYGRSGFNGTKATTPAVPAVGNHTGDPVKGPTVVYEAVSGEILSSIYTFESPAITSDAGRTAGTALVIGGFYNGETTDKSYYRVDLKTDSDLSANISSGILRNHSYEVEIESVTGAGYGTAEEAYMGAKPIGVTVKVIDWGAENRNPLGWTEAEPTANSYIVVSGKSIWIPVFGQVQQAMDAGHLAADWITNDMNLGAYIVWCDNSDVNGVVNTTSLTLKKGSSPPYTQIGLTAGNKQGNAVIAVYQDKNNNGVYDTGTDEIKWSWHVWVTDYKPSIVYELDVASDGIVGTDAENNKVFVYTSTGTPSVAYPHYGTVNVFMDRNLGALTNTVTSANVFSQMGLLYQWGRKDPFIGTATTAINTFSAATVYNTSGTTAMGTIGSGSLDEMIRSPFSYSTANAGSIVSSPADSWGGAQSGSEGNKSIYDPCPNGWRLPKAGAWNGIASNYSTVTTAPRYLYSSSLGYYPMAGYWDTASGGTQGGQRGYVWLAGASGSNGQQFLYYANNATPNSSAAKTFGCTVRCIQDNYVYTVKPFVTTDADYAYWPAIAEPITITVTSNTKWIASIKRSSNIVTWGESSALGQPLINEFNGGDINRFVTGGEVNTDTEGTITITPIEYIDPFREMEGDLTIVFHDANTGTLLNEANLTLGSGEIQQDANNCYVINPRGQGGRAILIPIYSQVSRALPQLGASWITTDMLTASSGSNLLEPVFVWTDRRGKQSGLGMAKDATVANVRVIRKRGSLQDAYLFVAIGTGEGNTVVGVMNDGLIKWSWHIWVHPDRDIIMAGDYSTGLLAANDWMDRNLGAYTKTWTNVKSGDPCTGMYYQWGRKDPYRGVEGYSANGVKFEYNTAPGTGLAALVNNPGCFMSNHGSNGDLSWDNGASDYKTPYDPCPKGWRVPRNGSWGNNSTEWTKSGSGRIWSVTGQYYPASGVVNDWGNFPLGTHGRFWSANTSDTNSAYGLNLINDNTNPVSSNNNRVNASSIRCIKDPYYTGN